MAKESKKVSETKSPDYEGSVADSAPKIDIGGIFPGRDLGANPYVENSLIQQAVAQNALAQAQAADAVRQKALVQRMMLGQNNNSSVGKHLNNQFNNESEFGKLLSQAEGGWVKRTPNDGTGLGTNNIPTVTKKSLSAIDPGDGTGAGKTPTVTKRSLPAQQYNQEVVKAIAEKKQELQNAAMANALAKNIDPLQAAYGSDIPNRTFNALKDVHDYTDNRGIDYMARINPYMAAGMGMANQAFNPVKQAYFEGLQNQNNAEMARRANEEWMVKRNEMQSERYRQLQADKMAQEQDARAKAEHDLKIKLAQEEYELNNQPGNYTLTEEAGVGLLGSQEIIDKANAQIEKIMNDKSLPMSIRNMRAKAIKEDTERRLSRLEENFDMGDLKNGVDYDTHSVSKGRGIIGEFSNRVAKNLANTRYLITGNIEKAQDRAMRDSLYYAGFKGAKLMKFKDDSKEEKFFSHNKGLRNALKNYKSRSPTDQLHPFQINGAYKIGVFDQNGNFKGTFDSKGIREYKGYIQQGNKEDTKTLNN